MENFKKKLEQLKFMYSGIIPNQNLKVINDRIDNPNCGPNKLILEVSATEALARIILIKLFIAQGLTPKSAFKKTDTFKIKEVIQKIYELKQKQLPSLFKSDDWKKFVWAIKFRNFLVHHATYVGGQTSTALIEATQSIRKTIKKEWL